MIMVESGGNDKKTLEVDACRGKVIVAEKSPDTEYPGIFVTVRDENGQEVSSCVLEYSPAAEEFQLRVYSPSDPCGDPTHVICMS